MTKFLFLISIFNELFMLLDEKKFTCLFKFPKNNQYLLS